MCLLTKTKKPQIAEKDIECVKVLCFNRITEHLETPFVGEVIKELPCVMDDTEIIAEIQYNKERCNSYCVTKGYIHSFPENTIYTPLERQVLVKCVIPKGTAYFEGIQDGGDNNCKSLCSKKLKLLEVIPPNEYLPRWEKWLQNLDITENLRHQCLLTMRNLVYPIEELPLEYHPKEVKDKVEDWKNNIKWE